MRLIDLAEQDGRDLLDDYVEAHVHGGVVLERDVGALVLDPCYRGTAVESEAQQLGVAVEWHGGFRTTVERIRQHPGFGGPDVVAATERVAVDGVLTPRIIGEAAHQGLEDGQVLKRVWHCTACFALPGI